jgi:hypothetical protein
MLSVTPSLSVADVATDVAVSFAELAVSLACVDDSVHLVEKKRRIHNIRQLSGIIMRHAMD